MLRERRIGLLQPYGEWNESLVSGDIWTPTAALPLLTKMTAKLTDVGTYKGRDIIVVSDVMTFTTVYALPVKPAIVVPVAGAKLPAKTATFVMSEYRTEPPTEIVQEAAEWTVKSGEVVVAASGVTTTALGKWEVNLESEILKNNTPRFMSAISLGGSGDWRSLAQGEGGSHGYVLVACGSGSGEITWSKNSGGIWDGPQSQPPSAPMPPYWQDITYGAGKFVVCGDRGYTSTSSIQSAWSPVVVVPGGTNSTIINSIAYGDNKFVICGQSRLLMTSSSGTSWSAQGAIQGIPDTDEDYTRVRYLNGKFILGTNHGYIASSTNGTSWTVAKQVPDMQYEWMDFTYGNGMYVAVGLFERMSTSLDGIIWTPVQQITNGSSSRNVHIAYNPNDNLFYLASSSTIRYAAHDMIWHTLPPIPNAPAWLCCCIDKYGKCILGGQGNRITTSILNSRESWTTVRRISGNIVVSDVIYANGMFVGSCSSLDDIIHSYDNGESWIMSKIANNSSGYSSIAYGKGVFVMGGTKGAFKVSTDGTTWENAPNVSGNTYGWYSIAYGNGIFVAGGNNGAIARSTDGRNWISTKDQGFNYDWNAVIYAEGRFIMCGDGGHTTESPDGISWTTPQIISPYTYDLYCMTYGNGVYVAGGRDTVLLISTDGITWESVGDIAGDFTQDWLRVVFGNGKFVISGRHHKVSTSLDGRNWTPPIELQTVYDADWYASAYGNNTYVVLDMSSSFSRLSFNESSLLTIEAKNKPTGLPWSEPSDPVIFTVMG